MKKRNSMDIVTELMPQLIQSGFVKPMVLNESDFSICIPKGSHIDSDLPRFGIEFKSDKKYKIESDENRTSRS